MQSHKDAAVNGLEAVAYVRQGAAYDHAHGVIEIRILHLIFDVRGDNIAAVDVAAVAARGGQWRRAVLRIFFGRFRVHFSFLKPSHDFPLSKLLFF